MSRATREPSVRLEHITRTILVLRGQRVILDAELAVLYGVTTRRLNEQIKRNADRLPKDLFVDFLTAVSRLASLIPDAPPAHLV